METVRRKAGSNQGVCVKNPARGALGSCIHRKGILRESGSRGTVENSDVTRPGIVRDEESTVTVLESTQEACTPREERWTERGSGYGDDIVGVPDLESKPGGAEREDGEEKAAEREKKGVLPS